MKPDKSPSAQTPKVVKLTESKPVERKGADAGEELRTNAAPDGKSEEPSAQPDSAAGDPRPTDADLSAVIKEGIVRAARKLFNEQPPPAPRQPWYASPIAAAFLTFILMGLGVAYVTYQFNRSLEELKSRHSAALKDFELSRAEAMKFLEFQRADEQRRFDQAREDQKRESDRTYQDQQKQIEYMRALQQTREELAYAKRQKDLDYSRQLSQGYVEYTRNLSAITNNARVQKAVEVLEKIGRAEVEIDRLLDSLSKGAASLPGPERQGVIDRIDELQSQMSEMIQQYDPYLRTRIAARFIEYVRLNGVYATERYVNGKAKRELGDLLKKREEAKPTINDIKNIVLEDELPPAKPPGQLQ